MKDLEKACEAFFKLAYERKKGNRIISKRRRITRDVGYFYSTVILRYVNVSSVSIYSSAKEIF